MEKSEENPIYNIQKKRQVNVLSTDYDYQSCQMIGGNNLKIKFDLLKLSSISPLVRKILASYDVPLFALGSLDFILPDSSLEELKILHHMMNSNDGATVCLSLDNWARLQSLLEMLDCSLASSVRDHPEDIITLEDDPGDDNENTIHDDLEFQSNLEVVGTGDLVKEELDSGDESFNFKHKDSRMVSILRNSQKVNSRVDVSKPSPSYVKSIFSSPEATSPAPAMEDVRQNMVKFKQSSLTSISRRTGGITQLESQEDEIEKPSKYKTFPPSSQNEKVPKPMPFSKKTEKFVLSKKSSASAGLGSRSRATWDTKKPEEGRAKSIPLSRTRSESQTDETEDISNLMKFFGPSTKPTPASTKTVKIKPKTDQRRTRRCGKCANCQINKQVKR